MKIIVKNNRVQTRTGHSSR